MKERIGVICCAGLCAGAAQGVTVTWQKIPMPAPYAAVSANDMSPDGRWVVGEYDENDDYFADGTYRWDRLTGEFVILPPEGLLANAVSDDGTTILGNIPDPDNPHAQVGVRAAIWKQATGWVSIGYLPDAGECPSRSSSYELSADGKTAIGLSWDGCNGTGFIWNQDTGMLPLENLAFGQNRASVITSDGSMIGGFAQGNYNRTPALWDGATHVGTLLDPPIGQAVGEIHGLRDDGSVLLGTWQTTETAGNEPRASMWTLDGGAWVRSELAAGSMNIMWQGVPTDIADNGMIVGYDFNPNGSARKAWIQFDREEPLVDLVAYLALNGIDMVGDDQLQVCQAVSTDGTVIAGHSWPMTGGWVVTIEPDAPACPWDTAPEGGDGTVGLGDLNSLLSNWGPCPAPCAWDFAPEGGDDTVGLGDLNALLSNWGVCP